MGLNNSTHTALVDTGATISLIRSEIADQLGLKLNRSNLTATGVTKDALEIIGQINVLATIERQWSGQHQFYVANNIAYPVIIGTSLLCEIGAVTYNFNDCTLHLNGGTGIPMEDLAVSVAHICNAVDMPTPYNCDTSVQQETRPVPPPRGRNRYNLRKNPTPRQPDGYVFDED